MWTIIAKCVKLAIDVENADDSPANLHNLPFTGRDFVNGCNYMLCHKRVY